MAIWTFRRKAKKDKSADQRLTTEAGRTGASAGSLNQRPAYAAEDNRPISDRGIQDSPILRRVIHGEVDAGDNHQASVDTNTNPEMNMNASPLVATGLENEKETHPVIDVGTTTRGETPSYYFLNPMSTASLASDTQRESWQRPPTLRTKRTLNDSGILRRISSKKKKKDDAREQKVKSMSATTSNLKRPLTHSGGPIRREHIKGPSQSERDLVRRNLSSSHIRRPDRPLSQGAPAFSDTLPPSLAPLMEHPTYKIKALDILFPRPSIRCWDAARYMGGASTTDIPSRSNSRRQRPPQPARITEGFANDHRRVNELADDLDSGGLRELMEREDRRRERKRKTEELRIQKKLERRAERQKREEEKRTKEVNVENINPFEDPADMVDVGIGTSSTGFDPEGRTRDPRKEDENPSPHSWLHDPSMERLQGDMGPEMSHRNSESHLEDPTPIDDQEEPVIGTAKAVRLSQASMSPPTSPNMEVRPVSNISQITDPFREPTVSTSEPTDIGSLGSSPKGGQGAASTWMSFFRRSTGKNRHDSIDRGRQTPSEFSNTSRDSLTRQALPASVRSSFQRRSGTPVRTTSKFREELPELPLSPPDSRLQSPIPVATENPVGDTSTRKETDSPNIYSSNVAANATAPNEPQTDMIIPKPKDGAPVHRQDSVDAPSIEGKAASTVISQSMASIDSEGSWLSGKPAKRISQNPAFDIRHSASSLHHRFQDFSDSGEELGVTEDEYFSRLSPGPEVEDQQQRIGHLRKPSSAAIASSDSEGDDQEEAKGGRPHVKEKRKWHGGVARHPTVVHHAPRAKSREGLLNDYQEASSPDGGELGDSPESDVRSFDYAVEEISKPSSNNIANVDQGRRQHLRHISAGSAKLLDIGPRSSTENRRSLGSTKSATTSPKM
ncbi:MAG: hypothetical protein M1816_005766 [Peltula sp. TS41687]|nr:MAG: hypothetical protein M1816_005766 [Peltula sp. TS41687]